ncbi:MAG: 1-acyl-sn-glycerol-3-phosphate acyltransferase [Lachnospiraceae bacterium]|nr:1-acyl-sn-glycerol-3-phosphate acyltransferase [Lachnospiraceae bacterium]
MRIVLVALAMVLFFILSFPIYLVLILVGKKNPHTKVRVSQSIVSWAFNIVLRCAGTKRTVIGAENVPSDSAVLYVFNHRSLADIPIIYTSVPTLTGFVAKKEIQKVPFLNLWMRNVNCLFLDRDDMRAGLKTILQGIEYIKQGYSMAIAPEGTRNHDQELLPFKEGSLKMAEKTGCPIIPVAINHSDAIFELHMPWVRKAHVVVEYGKPIYLNELPKEERKFAGAHVRTVITEMLNKNEPLV